MYFHAHAAKPPSEFAERLDQLVDLVPRGVRGQSDGDCAALVVDAQGVEKSASAVDAADGSDAVLCEMLRDLLCRGVRDGEAQGGDTAGCVAEHHHVVQLLQRAHQVVEQPVVVVLQRPDGQVEAFTSGSRGSVVEVGEIVDRGDDPGQQRVLVAGELEPRGALGERIERHRRDPVEHRRVAEDERSDLWSTPRGRVDCEDIGGKLVDVDVRVGRSAGSVDDDVAADGMHEVRGCAYVGSRADDRRCRCHRDETGGGGDEFLELPTRQFTCELPSWQFEELITATTRLVAMTAASPIVGSAPDVRAAADLVHAVGGHIVVDAAGAAPYAHVDINELAADVLAVDASAWGGPQVGALVFRDPAMLDRIPSMSLDPFAKGAARLELAGHQYALLAGVVSSIDYLANLDDAATGTRRERLDLSIGSLQDYHDRLFDYLMRSLEKLDHVMVLGDAPSRIPTLSFTVADTSAEKVSEHLAQNRIGTVSGVHSGSRLLDALGVNDEGGAVTIGLAPYTTRYEIDQLVKALGKL